MVYGWLLTGTQTGRDKQEYRQLITVTEQGGGGLGRRPFLIGFGLVSITAAMSRRHEEGGTERRSCE